MRIKVNGEEKDIQPGQTVQDLLGGLGYGRHPVAVALNLDFVNRANYAETKLSENDEIEIVAPQQGG